MNRELPVVLPSSGAANLVAQLCSLLALDSLSLVGFSQFSSSARDGGGGARDAVGASPRGDP